MSKKSRKTGLVSLAYSDSENEDDSMKDDDDEELEDDLSCNISVDEDDASNVNKTAIEPEQRYYEDVFGDKDMTILEFHNSLYGKSFDEIKVPPPTKQQCQIELQNKIENLYEKVKMGYNFNNIIQKRKDLRNPSIYEKMISYCQIDEMATNYPNEMYNPEPFLGHDSYYEQISKLQKEEMEKKERERKEILKSESTASSKKISTQPMTSVAEKRSKWDSGPNLNNPQSGTNSAAIAAAVARVQNIVQANAAKPKVIAAFGTISKKK